MNKFVYADNAATTKLDIEAHEAMTEYFLKEYANPSQPYSFSRETKKALKYARKTIAECIGAKPDEIYFTSGGTESDNWAIKGIALNGNRQGDIITTEFEHHAILNSCKAVERLGVPVLYLSPNCEGRVTPDILEPAITHDTKLVSIMYANNEIGIIQPIKELCEIAHKNGALFHTDAVQAVGHIGIDVDEIGVDMLSASAHKFNGPRGIGFLYIRKGCNIEPFINGGAQERGLRAGTENTPAIVAMAIALKKNCMNLEKNSSHVQEIENLFLTELRSSNVSFKTNGAGEKLPGIISIAFKGYEGEAILHRLDLMGIYVSTGSACDSVNTEISHVLKAISLDEDLAKGTIRISLGKDNTKEDVRAIVDALKRIVR